MSKSTASTATKSPNRLTSERALTIAPTSAVSLDGAEAFSYAVLRRCEEHADDQTRSTKATRPGPEPSFAQTASRCTRAIRYPSCWAGLSPTSICDRPWARRRCEEPDERMITWLHYVILTKGEVLDPQRYEEYKVLAGASIQAAGGRFIVRGGEFRDPGG